MTRMAGQLIQRALGAGLLGTGGAVAADALMHDDLDRLAQSARDLQMAFAGTPPEVQQVYMDMFGQGEVSSRDRLMATSILLEGADTPWATGVPIQADSPAGAKAIETALQLRQSNPTLANTLAAMVSRESDLLARGMSAGVEPTQVLDAVNQGAGVSPLPAMAGGIGLGALGAALPSARNAFRAQRKG